MFCVRQSSVRGCRFSFVFVYLLLSVDKFKTLDKTNKINTILCKLNFYLLAYLAFFHQKCEQTVNILREREGAE